MSDHESNLKPPFVDVEAIRERMVAFYDEAPYKETAQAFVLASQEILDAFTDAFSLGMDFPTIEDRASRLDARLAWYSDALEGSDEDDDVINFVLDPLLDGEYPEELGAVAPKWPDAETLWRLMNQMTAAVGGQIEGDMLAAAYDALREAYEDAFRLFWNAVSVELARIAEQVPEGFSEQMSEDLAVASATAAELTEDATAYITDTPSKSGSGSLALGVLGIGALLLAASRRRR